MKIIKEIIRPEIRLNGIIIAEEKYHIIEKRKCDLCGKETHDDEWFSDIYSLIDLEIKMEVICKKGKNDINKNGKGILYEIDLCPECFERKLVKWLNSQGAEIKKIEWNW